MKEKCNAWFKKTKQMCRYMSLKECPLYSPAHTRLIFFPLSLSAGFLTNPHVLHPLNPNASTIYKTPARPSPFLSSPALVPRVPMDWKRPDPSFCWPSGWRGRDWIWQNTHVSGRRCSTSFHRWRVRKSASHYRGGRGVEETNQNQKRIKRTASGREEAV